MTGLPELNARRTAAAAVLADFRREIASAPLSRPPGREWMFRLADVLGYLLAALGQENAPAPLRPEALGPFETGSQVSALPEVQAVYEAFDADPGTGKMAPHLRRLLGQALEAADVTMGRYDDRVAEWLAGLDPQTVAVIAGWISRAHQAGTGAGNRHITPDEASIILSALADASEGIRERAAYCPDCQASPASLCDDCAGRLDKATEYDILARHLGGAPSGGQGLSATAKATLAGYGISPAAWARTHFADGRWHGDACGCPDDRCIGYHHDDPDNCGCLTALLTEPLRSRLTGDQPGGAR